MNDFWEFEGGNVLVVTMYDFYIWMMLNHFVEHIELKSL